MGDIFGGGGGAAPAGHWETPPNPASGIPNGDPLTAFAASRLNAAAPGINSPFTTAQLGFGHWNPATMQMHLPQFNPQIAYNPMMNPWINGQSMQNFGLGAYQYVPPGANSLFNPAGSFPGLAGMQMPQFNQQSTNAMPNFSGPYGPGGGQPQQQQNQNRNSGTA